MSTVAKVALHAASPRASAPLPPPVEAPRRLEAITPGARHEVEQFIARRFHEVYAARIHAFMPSLHGLRDASGELVAAVGLRRADEGRLFLEQYLPGPVESLLADGVSRSHIAEVGNLAGATPGALRAVIPQVTHLLHREGIRWIAFTGSARICNAFTRLGLPLRVAAPASIDCLPECERTTWGSYYDSDPAVMIGEVAAGMRLLESARRLDGLARIGAP